MLDLQVILKRRSLSVESVLQETHFGATYLVIDQSKNRYVLKVYRDASKSRGSLVERKFLTLMNKRKFQNLLIPQLIEHDQNYMLMEFVDREEWTRDTILDREWSESDIQLWVSGLIEFQAIKVPPNWFSFYRRIFGRFYPVIRTILVIKYGWTVLRLRGMAKVSWLCILYLANMHHFRFVLTHYDLQTHNYSLTTDLKRASMLDFEIAYYPGDALFDLLYYNSIPVVRLENWSYQTKILREYTKATDVSTEGFAVRMKLILILCNLLRCCRFRNDQAMQSIYKSNLKDIMNDEWFDKWLGSLDEHANTEVK